jgi:hypothetical protein
MKLIYFLFLAVFLIAGCSPLDKKYSSLTVSQDLKDIKDYGASSADTALLHFFIDNKNFRKIDIKLNITYKQLLEQARFTLMNRELNDIKIYDETALKTAFVQAKIDSMRNVISTSLVSKDNNNDFNDIIQMKFNIHNNSEKDIRAFKGDIIFKDVFGDVLKKYDIECDILIAAHQAIMYNAQIKYDQFLDSDIKLLNAEVSDIQFVFDPKFILFDDGSKMVL